MRESASDRQHYLVFALLFIVASFFILKSFLFGMVWGGVTALAAWPVFERVTGSDPSSSGRPCLGTGVAALLFALLFLLLFVVPLAYAGYELANAYSAGASYLASQSAQGALAPPAFLRYLPFSDKLALYWRDTITPGHGVLDILNRLSHGQLLGWLSVLWGQLMNKVVSIVVMLISFYFLLKNGEVVKRHYRRAFLRWTGEKSLPYVENGLQALRGTINGVVLVGILEGLVLSVPLVLGGLSSGFLLALMAGMAGVIPLLMPALILPCLGYLYLTGHTTWAIVGAVDLALVWFLFENLIKPALISHTVKVNTFLILAAMIGGLQWLGLVGLFLGPAIVAMAAGMLQDLLTGHEPG